MGALTWIVGQKCPAQVSVRSSCTPLSGKMLISEDQLGVKMGPRSVIDAPAARTLRRLVATLLAVDAVHADDASTKDQCLSMVKPINCCRAFLLTRPNDQFPCRGKDAVVRESTPTALGRK